MVNCPICGRELQKQTPGGWECECGEFIPDRYAAAPESKCSCETHHHC